MMKQEFQSMKGRVTTFDIAAIAGVPQKTVSMVLRGEASVDAETRQRIIRIAADIGYHSEDLPALRKNTLSVLIFEDSVADGSLQHPFFVSMIAAITQEAALHGYDMLVSFESQYEEMPVYCRGCQKSDGVILLGHGDFNTYQYRVRQMLALGVHFIRYSCIQDHLPGPMIYCDNYQGALTAVRHLIGLGRKRIAFIGNMADRHPAFSERFRGYTHALRETGVIPLPPLQVDAVSQVESGRVATQGLLARRHPLDAIFAASDMIAMGAVQALHQAGLKVPEDVSVVGFDDIWPCELVSPPLTTVHQDVHLAARALVGTLLQEFAGLPAEDQALVPKLVVRESCGAGIIHKNKCE